MMLNNKFFKYMNRNIKNPSSLHCKSDDKNQIKKSFYRSSNPIMWLGKYGSQIRMVAEFILLILFYCVVIAMLVELSDIFNTPL